MSANRPPLKTVADALAALEMDRLALVTYTATEVFVSTAFGAGRFKKSDWYAANAPKNSMEKGK